MAEWETAKPIDHSGMDKLDEIEGKFIRDETFRERRDDEAWEGQQYGPPVASENLQAALGHWAETDAPETINNAGEAKLLRGQDKASDDVKAQHVASNEIHNHYMIASSDDYAKSSKMLTPEDTKLDLSSPDARLKSLDNLTQERPDGSGEETCAASSLVGGALLAGGGKNNTAGLSTLMTAMDENAGDDDARKNIDAELAPLREKLKTGQITVEDMHHLQSYLYDEMDAKEKGANPDDRPGIDGKTMEGFIGNSKELHEMMVANKMGVSYIDNDGTKANNHAVLSIGRGDGEAPAIYDPALRDEGQIVTGDTETAEYKLAEKKKYD